MAVRKSVLHGTLASILGVIFFLLMFDVLLLEPTYYEWLLRLDPATQFIGWHFFRHESWHIPLGAANNYGMEMGGSIVYTDSIPLLAIAFKILNAVLPAKFQYFGIWMLVCFMAQGVFGWLLSGLLTSRVFERYVITVFFLISPIMVDRALGHYALMSHWVILGALYLYLRRSNDSQAAVLWCVLLSLAAMIHAYLLYIGLAIWFAYLVHRIWIDRAVTYRQGIKFTVATCGTVLFAMWIAGYFTIPVSDFSGGATYYGRYAANLNSLWNPLWGSRFLPPLPVVPGSEAEGFNYLGFGILLMVPIVVTVLLRSYRSWAVLRAYVPLIGVSLVLWVMALSNQIAWGPNVLITIPLPQFVLEMLAIVRGSGRLLWVAHYGIVLVVLGVTVRHFKPKVAALLLTLSLTFQVVDLSLRYSLLEQHYHELYINEPQARVSPLQSAFWQVASKQYKNILFVPMTHAAKDYDAFALFAGSNDMKINVGLFARVSYPRVAAAESRLRDGLATGQLMDDSLYILWDSSIEIPYRLSPQDGSGFVDGYFVIAPKWFEFEECCGPQVGRPLIEQKGLP